MTKVICISGTQFALPDNMSAKDIQALAGFLISLSPVNAEYDWDSGEHLHYISGKGVEIRVDTAELMDKGEALARSKITRERYEARRAAEKAAAAE
jgi:hypothetical protein